MHELAVTRALVEETLRACAKNGVKEPYRVETELGALTTYGKGPIMFYWGILRKDHPGLSKTRLTIRTAPALMRCGACGRRKIIRGLTELFCGKCGSAGADVEGGRDFMIRRILRRKPNSPSGKKTVYGEKKCAEHADARRQRRKRSRGDRGRILGRRRQ